METYFWMSALFAEIIGTMAGFGSSTIFLPIALLFYDFKTAKELIKHLKVSDTTKVRVTYMEDCRKWVEGIKKELQNLNFAKWCTDNRNEILLLFDKTPQTMPFIAFAIQFFIKIVCKFKFCISNYYTSMCTSNIRRDHRKIRD